MVEMMVYGLSFDISGKQPIVLLKSVHGSRYLPIWIGHAEAASIVMRLQDLQTPRPITHDLFINVILEMGGVLERIVITHLENNTFHAELIITQNKVETAVDCRPSDAIALALRAEASIYATEQVLLESSVRFDIGDDAERDKATIDDFKQFLDDVDPEDFGNS